MRKILTMGIVCMFLFAASAAASYFLVVNKTETDIASADSTESANADSTPAMTVNVRSGSESPLPAATNGVSADTILTLSQSLRERDATLQKREELAAKNEERIRFALDDLQRHQAKLQEQQKTIDIQLIRAERLVEKMQEIRSTKAGELPLGQTDPSNPKAAAGGAAASSSNLRAVSNWLKGLPPELAAESVRQWSNDGQMDLAAKLLSMLEEREATNILAALGDSTLFNQLVQKRIEMAGQ